MEEHWYASAVISNQIIQVKQGTTRRLSRVANGMVAIVNDLP